jgi:hypothetical protein
MTEMVDEVDFKGSRSNNQGEIHTCLCGLSLPLHPKALQPHANHQICTHHAKAWRQGCLK